jgi:gamma-glutamyltranspeptidase/glutathione hydrolase
MLALSACSERPELDDHSQANAVEAKRHMVVSANRYASQIGREILRNGGNAMDAAVATKIALTFVEPHETGLAGGGFLVYYDAENDQQLVYDGRETAPQAATEEWFRLFDTVPLHHYLAVVSGRAVGTPGMVAMLHKAHADHGRLPWAQLFDDAIELAEAGIPMPPRLQRQLYDDLSLRLFGDIRRNLSHRGEPRLQNDELAATFKLLAKDGPSAMYRGSIGHAYRERANNHWWLPNKLTADDFASYEARVRDVVCGTYRGYRICGPPPPSSGGITVLQILGLLEPFDISSMRRDSLEFNHLLADASRLAFADRQYHIADPAFERIDTQGLISRSYLLQRSNLLDRHRIVDEANPGIPGITIEFERAPPVTEDEELGTSHVSVVDEQGNAVSLTGSIEAPFGSRMMAAGMIMNNQLTDFDFRPEKRGLPVANRVEGGKRPRSSMAPTMVFNPAGELQFVLGSRGGSRIIGYVVKTLIGLIDWDLSLQQAIDLPNSLHRGERLELEAGTELEKLQEVLEAMGHEVTLETLASGVHGLERTENGWRGAADGRMEGAALGD